MNIIFQVYYEWLSCPLRPGQDDNDVEGLPEIVSRRIVDTFGGTVT
jgi:hypothetical protein